MKSARNFILILFFLGLAALEVTHGLFRLEAVRERQRQSLLQGIESGYRDLAGEVHSALAEKREHAAFLAAAPAVSDLLAAPVDPARRDRVESLLLPYLLAFHGIDRIRLLDDAGREVFRCERIGGAAGVLPPALLAIEPDAGVLALVDDLPPGEVAVSSLVIDHERVEVPESDRQVLHYVAAVVLGDERRGILALTVYARRLLKAVRHFSPVEGVSAVLVDAGGRYVQAASGRRKPDESGSTLFAERVQAATQLLSGADRVESEDVTYMGLEVHEKPRWFLVCRIPESSLEQASSHLRGEYTWIIGSTVILTAVLALAAAFLVRLSARELRLREHSRYLRKYRALMDGAADMILIVDPATGEIRESNAMAREHLRLPDPGLEALQEAFPAALEGRRVALSDVRVRGRDGHELDVDARLSAIDLEEARVIEVSLRDLTRQKELERRLRISERLGSLGLLTAGVAHEVNNPLEGIGNYLALLDRETTAPEKRKSYLALVRQGFDRIRDIVSDLASFARAREGGGAADISQVIDRALTMVRYSRQFHDVDVELIGLDAPVRVAGEAGRLEQVFINLFLNAAGATEGRGSITVEARRVRTDPEAPRGENSSLVEVRVEDDGPGIPDEDLTRIFDPFFTRRDSDGGAGLGLGLFISYGIVDAHGGSLWAENRQEGGARFVVRLPVSESAGADGATSETAHQEETVSTGIRTRKA